MPKPTRIRHQEPDYDDFDDEPSSGFETEIRQEKIRQLVQDLIGRWYWVALFVILGILAGFYYLSKAPEIYSAKSTLLVKQQMGSVMAKSDQVDEIDLRTDDAMNTVAQRVLRQDLLKKIAARPDILNLPGIIPEPVNWLPHWAQGWFPDPKEKQLEAQKAPADALPNLIRNWTSVDVRRNTRLVDITVEHPSPEVAQALADAIATEYQTELTGVRSEGRMNSMGILDKESDEARTHLQTAQNALANYKRVLDTLEELELREKAVLDLSRKYKAKHPKMVTAQSDLNTFQQRFLSEFDSVRSSPVDRQYWEDHNSELTANGSDDASRLQVARRLLVARQSVLESEIESQTNVFNSILTRKQEQDINQQGTESEMEISSLAELPKRPVSPKKPLILGAAFIGGGFFGLIIAMILTRLDNKLHTVGQAEQVTGLPVLAAIPDIPTKALSQATRKRKVNLDSIPVARRRWDPHLVFREGTSNTTFAEMYRVLRASVSLLGDEKKRKVTLFSSALPGEGKTTTSCNFAIAAAQQGKRTLLVDLDLRKPSVHKNFGIQRDTHPSGSTEILAGQAKFEDSIYTDTGEKNLHIILSGKRAPNPGELLNATKLEEFLKLATSYYDVVVLDSAPLLAVPDTRILAPMVDNFCIVTRAEYGPKGAIRRVISLLRADDNLPAGIIFNGFLEKKRLIGANYSYGNYQTNRYGKAYRYGYGSYGSYGAYGDEDED
ncbi:polysaccharide biosynthesis tyrosine autokinase [Luteolibacter pohnpeiensis]|uniref:Polysaccharide biosynthesis tyrosine autokinase n=1 Tax=Luteolibacter pohnpeiensis TaxID=454153 RepID=A0A934SBU9_9BACT|nr:polysaccharide biosynthesis tyrosine autokinase [Luteolibacter pohnpeiensis]MBK1883044.1 polysaccharide biosynthesis tyrosine autokinase [Luteolibacter pohnpeiensis]